LKKVCMTVSGFFLILSCLSTVAAILGSFYFWLFLRLPAKPIFEKKQFFIPHTSAFGVAKLLQSQEVIRDARAFYLLGWLKNSLHHMQTGEYAFSTLLTPEQVLDQIINGKVVIHTVTVPEGSTLWDVARIFDQKELAPQNEIIEIAGKAEFARSLEVKAKGLEGYLFPDTYQFKKPVTSASITTAMVRRFWQRLPREWPDRMKELGLSLHEIVILASIIEKEAVVDSERPVIAGVFYNRLKINMPLQSDPTAVYDIPGFSGPVTAAHLTRQSPYNTYHIRGLPPGPICSPGAQSIKAALNPEKGAPYLYFVSNNDGTHHFSFTSEKNRNAVSHYYEMKKKTLGDTSPTSSDTLETPSRDGRAGAEPNRQADGVNTDSP